MVEDESHLAAGLKLNFTLEGFEVDIAWKDGNITSTKIRSLLGKPCEVHAPNYSTNLEIAKGDFVVLLPPGDDTVGIEDFFNADSGLLAAMHVLAALGETPAGTPLSWVGVLTAFLMFMIWLDLGRRGHDDDVI